MKFSQKYLDVIWHVEFIEDKKSLKYKSNYQIFSIEIFFRFCVTSLDYFYVGHPSTNPNELDVSTRCPMVYNLYKTPLPQKFSRIFESKFYGHNPLISKPNPKIGILRLIGDNVSISIEHSATELTNNQNQDPLTR